MDEKTSKEEKLKILNQGRKDLQLGLQDLQVARNAKSDKGMFDHYILALSSFANATKCANTAGRDGLAGRLARRFLKTFGEGWDKQQRYLAFPVEAIRDGIDFAENYLGLKTGDFDCILIRCGYAKKTIFQITGEGAFSPAHDAMRGIKVPYIPRTLRRV